MPRFIKKPTDDAGLLEGQDGSYYLDRTNQTGPQAASTVSDFDTDVGNLTDVAANTTHRGTATGNPHCVTAAEAGALATGTKLDELAAPTDVTTLNVSTTAHGLTPKLSNVATQYLNGTGSYSVPAGAGDVVGPASATDNAITRFDLTTGKLLQNSVTS